MVIAIKPEEYVYSTYENIKRVRALSKEQRNNLLQKYREHDWFIDASGEDECDECYNAPFGVLFPLTGEPIFDKNCFDIQLCEECFLAHYAKDELEELIK